MDINKIITESIANLINEDVKEKVGEDATTIKEKVGEALDTAKEKAKTALVKTGEVAEEAKGKATDAARKAVEAVKENPVTSAAVAAALAAGVGALVLRKRLKKANK